LRRAQSALTGYISAGGNARSQGKQIENSAAGQRHVLNLGRRDDIAKRGSFGGQLSRSGSFHGDSLRDSTQLHRDIDIGPLIRREGDARNLCLLETGGSHGDFIVTHGIEIGMRSYRQTKAERALTQRR
jgi:hypothetical protein